MALTAQDVTNQIAALTAVVTQLSDVVRTQGGPTTGREDLPKDYSLTGKRGFMAVEKFGGKVEDFDDWHFKIKRFLEDEAFFPDYLLFVESHAGDITLQDQQQWGQDYAQAHNGKDPDVLRLNHQLYQVLAQNLSGVALGIVKSLAADITTRGANAWIRIMKEYRGFTGQRMLGLIQRIISPKRVNKYSDVSAAVANWELMITEYENGSKMQGGNQFLFDDYLKVHGFKLLMPLELDRDITRLSTTVVGYAAIKNYALEQAALKKDPVFTSPMTNAPTAKAAPMDLDLLWQDFVNEKGREHDELQSARDREDPGSGGVSQDQTSLYAFGKGGKGKGGKDHGKGGSFPGNCHHCGRYGHRAAQCPVKDAEMAQARAGHSKGKGGWKGQWGSGTGKGFNNVKGKGKGWSGKGTYWFDEAPTQQTDWNVPGNWLYSISKKEDDTPHPQMTKVQNSYSVLDTEDEFADDIVLPAALDAVDDLLSEADMIQHPKLQLQQADQKAVCQNGQWIDVRSKKKMQKMKKTVRWKPFIGALWETCRSKDCCPVQPAAREEVELAGVNYRSEEAGWTKVRVIPDSGAVESVAPANMAPNYRVHKSPGSERGQMYTTASGDEIPNEGQQFLPSVCENGVCSEQKWQLSAVTRPLQSVGELCDAGHRVVFGRSGGVIQNVTTGEETYITREHGTYLVDLWIPPVSQAPAVAAAGFQRQGRA